ncbi:MAG: hypothetical protein WAW63_04120 [Candidatus Saccharimonadales bacterium]
MSLTPEHSSFVARGFAATVLLGIIAWTFIHATGAELSDKPDGFSLSPDAQSGRYNVRIEGGYVIQPFSLSCRGIQLVIGQPKRPDITVPSELYDAYKFSNRNAITQLPCPDGLIPENRPVISFIVGQTLKSTTAQP